MACRFLVFFLCVAVLAPGRSVGKCPPSHLSDLVGKTIRNSVALKVAARDLVAFFHGGLPVDLSCLPSKSLSAFLTPFLGHLFATEYDCFTEDLFDPDE